jgi:hypothetical protein
MQMGLETQVHPQGETHPQIYHQGRVGSHSKSLSACPACEQSTTVDSHGSLLIDVVFAMFVFDAIYAT